MTSCSARRSPRRQAGTAGHSTEEELLLLTTHGILHLLGFDHAEPDEEREMFDLQRKLLLTFLADPGPRVTTCPTLWLVLLAAVLLVLAGVFAAAEAGAVQGLPDPGGRAAGAAAAAARDTLVVRRRRPGAYAQRRRCCCAR